MIQRLWYQLLTAGYAITVLYRELGLENGTIALVKTIYHRLRGEPWRQLEPARSKKERQSRKQAALVIILYHVVCELVSSEQAYLILLRIVEVGGCHFLKAQLPRIKRKKWLNMNPEDRNPTLQGWVSKFPNVTLGLFKAHQQHFKFQVNHCEFVTLTADCGYPELAKLFCAGDARYFEKEQPDVTFTRGATLAEHQRPCEFSFTLTKPADSGR